MNEMKKRGRPPKMMKAEPWPVLAMRVRPDVYEQLRLDAESNGRSISAEAERRVMHREPGANEIGRLVDIAISKVELRSEGSWIDNEDVARQCRYAVETVVNLTLGDAENIDKKIAALSFNLDRRRELEENNAGPLTQAIAASIPSIAELQGAVEKINGIILAISDGESTVAQVEEEKRE